MPSMGPAVRALLDHPAECCRWPLGDGWCQRKATHRAYCREHHELSRDPVQQPPSQQTISRWLHTMSLRMMRGRPMRRAA